MKIHLAEHCFYLLCFYTECLFYVYIFQTLLYNTMAINVKFFSNPTHQDGNYCFKRLQKFIYYIKTDSN